MNSKVSLVEQAARRLAELERAGVVVPWQAAAGGASAPVVSPVAPSPLPAALPVSPSAGLAMPTLVPAIEPPAAPVAPAPAADVVRAAPARSVELDLVRLKEMGYLVPEQLRSEMAQQFRNVKRPLLKIARDENGPRRARHVMITSALPGEGKTFFSLNLAMSMAMEVDTAVILVDADVVRPSVFGRYDLDAGVVAPTGLLDYLEGDDRPLNEFLVSTNVPKLTLMSRGRANERASELMSSDGMEKLLDRLSTEYADHVVIFDAPPLLLTTESIALAGKVGQVVVVVESDKTTRTAVKRAFDMLHHCPVVSTVLNKCTSTPHDDTYGYYYG